MTDCVFGGREARQAASATAVKLPDDAQECMGSAARRCCETCPLPCETQLASPADQKRKRRIVARILFAWELGGGLGHVVPHLSLIDGLIARGHEICFALRNTTAHALLAQRGVKCLQAPVHRGTVANPFQSPLTYVHILHNCGYDNPERLRGLVQGWRSLFERVQPDLTVFDHAPSAILASTDFSIRRVALGTGFYVPPDVYPLPNLRLSVTLPTDELRASEDRTLSVINAVRDQLQLGPLARIADLFRLDAKIFRTYPELDHYRDRTDGEYAGIPPSAGGAAPVWPAGKGRRVFAYLKTPGAREVLRALRTAQQPALVYIHGNDPDVKREFSAPHLNFSDRPLDISAVARSCGVAILNGTHDTAVHFLLAGIPVINLPLHLEQSIVAARIAELGAGIYITTPRAELVLRALSSLETTDRFQRCAADFADRHRAPDAETRLGRLLNRVAGFAENR